MLKACYIFLDCQPAQYYVLLRATGIDLRERGSGLAHTFMDLLYPRRCPLCNVVLPFQRGKVCRSCLERLEMIQAPVCMKCGKSIESVEQEYCRDCEAIPKHFKRGYPVFHYKGAIKDALYAFKYDNQRDYADFFVECVLQRYGKELQTLELDGIIPVPVHRHKRKMRGYNQAELLAKQIGRRLKIKVYADYLERCVDTSPQKELNDKIRMKNLKNAFKMSENAIKLKRVLLVDDIYTSGATIEACTSVLLAAGVEDIYYTSIAIGKGYSE